MMLILKLKKNCDLVMFVKLVPVHYEFLSSNKVQRKSKQQKNLKNLQISLPSKNIMNICEHL